jgi:cysteine-rich repeat protein
MRVAILALVLAGCTTFSSMSPPEDAGVQIARVELSDGCEADEIVVLEEGTVVLSTEGLLDSSASAEQCGALGLADGFFTFRAAAGERVHVSAAPSDPAQDVGLYYMRSCGATECGKVQDRCGAGLTEPSTFVAPSVGDWIVLLETDLAAPIELTFGRPQCGDGVLEAGESCDDGNVLEGDGCDERCRAEVAASEVEPNDEHALANLLGAASTIAIEGELEGCDVDRFALELAAGNVLSLQLADTGAVRCADGIEVELYGPGGERSVLLGAAASNGSGATCPSIEPTEPFATIVESGEHHVVVSAAEAFSYRLSIEVMAP